MSDVLGLKQLNRATLARQMLLAREKTTALRAVERLAGLQAQLARQPFIGLWSRLVGFQAEDLTRLAHDRKVVRYLAAFGPASVRDAQTWSGLLARGEAFEALRPKRARPDVRGANRSGTSK